MELIILLVIGIFVAVYRQYQGQNVYKFIVDRATVLYDKFAPYSFKVVREKTKELGQEYTPKQYMMQGAIFTIFAGVISYLYFYNILISIFYILAANISIPYLAFLRCKRVYRDRKSVV